MPVTEDIAHNIVEQFAGGEAWTFWKDVGSLDIRGLFGWLWDGVSFEGTFEPGIGGLIYEEFEMYLYYQQNRNSAENQGWLQNIIYGLT